MGLMHDGVITCARFMSSWRDRAFLGLRILPCAFLVAWMPGSLTLHADDVRFQSRWDREPDRIWLGASYWANPHQDWRVRDGRLECIRGGHYGPWDRNVHLLTWQTTSRSSLTTRVTVGKMRHDFTGWAGFRVGARGKLNDYRHNCIYGKGIDAGLRTDGSLFLGNEQAPCRFEGAVQLELRLKPDGTRHHGTLRALDDNGGVLASVEKGFPSNRVNGNLALVVHTDSKEREGQVHFADWQVAGGELAGGRQQNWGPILWTQYTLSRGVLKLTAQMVPLAPGDNRTVALETRHEGEWHRRAEAPIDPLSRTATFRIADWDDSRDTPYRVTYALKHRDGSEKCLWNGVVRRDPGDREEVSVAAFTGNKDFAFPNTSIVENVRRHDPDVLFFSGDQLYEDVARFGIKRQPLDIATLDYLRKWYLYGWAFGDLMRDRPTVSIPDDHDVFQGNIWGQGGRKLPEGKRFNWGGYRMPSRWVNMVERTQTSHLPDPFDPRPVEQGIGVYYTDMVYGRISFAILEDRKFKWGPKSNAARNHPDETELLGDRQLAFLRHWAADWRGCDMKAALSQTVFAQAHTHGGFKHRKMDHSRDSNGWPPHARNAALRELRKGFAFMLAGDNHLPTIVHHGIDTWGDAGYSFTVPSIAAGYPRAWRPDQPGRNRRSGMPEYTGQFTSPFGHPITMWAAANPRVWEPKAGDLEIMDKKSSGYGLVRFNKKKRDITIECWRLLADLDNPEQGQFPGWPMTVSMADNYGREPVAWLPTVKVLGKRDPVVQVVHEVTDEIIYTLRIRGTTFEPKVFAPGTYTLRAGEPGRMRTRAGVRARDSRGTGTVTFSF